MISPFQLPPHPSAQAAAAEVIKRVHAYMNAHPESELHRQGKMFGVLVVEKPDVSSQNSEDYLAAFSAQLDGSYFHEGFVPPVYEMSAPPVGTSRAESQRLQRLLFANYQLVNGLGESKNLREIFADEKPIIPAEEWFERQKTASLKVESRKTASLKEQRQKTPLPPSGAGECCAPKLLQYALTHNLRPLALAEFWVGAPSRTEIRHEGTFYAPCSGRCVPILRFMMQGLSLNVEGVKLNEEGVKLNEEGVRLNEEIEILYEDEYLVVVNKPSGLLSVPGKNDEPSVESCLSHPTSAYPDGRPVKAVHRLDQDTSGVLVLAKTPDVYKTLQAYFQRRDILKRYEAVVQPEEADSGQLSAVSQAEGTIELPLLPNPYDRPRQTVNKEHGKTAITRYKLRERRPDGTCLVDFFPLTGRTHQLRVHAAHPEGLNAPIVGDRLYGTHTDAAERLMLHAAEITFTHPVTQKELHFCVPSDF